MTPLRLGYLGLAVPDPDAWAPFAHEVLECGYREPTGPMPAQIVLDDDRPAIFLERSPETDVRFLGWEFPDHATATDRVRRLTELGIEVVPGPDTVRQSRRVDGLWSFDDPFGYRHEIYFGPHRRLRTLPSQLGHPELGHAFLLVGDPAEAEEFFGEGLGLPISDRISFTMGATPFEPGDVPVDVSFLLAHHRHHVLAVAGLPDGGPTRGLAHIMIEVDSLDEVGKAYDACLDRDLLVTTIGRHTNDEVVSFYLSAPGGVVIEFGCGGRPADPGPHSIPRYDAPSLWGHRPYKPTPETHPAHAE
ncbi:VOC family protein [Nocardia sp. CA-290969]|uniref:VOC family protein n=1 Tax=Nocardia sp. CA-290969 TaxID=3239986 RepID=UPI003D9065F9